MTDNSLPPGYSASDVSQPTAAPPAAAAQTTSLPPGYSASDVAGGASANDPSTANVLTATGENLPPQTGTAGEMSPEAEAASKEAADNQFTDPVSAIAGGAASTLLGHINSGLDLTSIPHDTLRRAQASIENSNINNPVLRNVGSGIETVTEFMAGDEAIAALPVAKQLAVMAKAMDTIGASPKLMAAVRFGIDGIKGMASMTPEEQAFVRSSPRLMKLVSLGMRNVRQGVVQGVQSFVDNDTDVSNRAKDAGEEGLEAGAVGAGLEGSVGPLIKRGMTAVTNKLGGLADDADTIRLGLSDSVKNTPSAQDAQHGLKEDLRASRQYVEDLFNNNAMNTTIPTDLSPAQAEHDLSIQKAGATRDQVKGDIGRATEKAQSVAKGEVQPEKDAIEAQRQSSKAAVSAQLSKANDTAAQGLERAKQGAGQAYSNSLTDVAPGEVGEPEELAGKLGDALTQAESDAHTKYESGINGPEGIGTKLKGLTLDPKDNELARGSLKQMGGRVDKNAHPLAEAWRNMAGNKLDPEVKQLIEDTANGQITKTVGSGKKAVTTQTPYGPLDIDTLISMRQDARKTMAGFPRGDINRQYLGEHLTNIDSAINELASKSDDPGVKTAYDSLRENYATSRSLLDSNTADKLKLNDPDKALNDVNQYLLSGNNSLGKINTIKSLADPETWNSMVKTKVRQLSDLAQSDPTAARKAIEKIPANVRQAFFGDMNPLLDKANTIYDDAVSHAENYHGQVLDANKQYHDLQQAAVSNTARDASRNADAVGATKLKMIEGASEAAIQRVSDKYGDAVNDATAKLASAKATAATKDAAGKVTQQSAKDAALKNNDNDFVKALANGSAFNKLSAGDVAVNDLKAVKNVLPKDKWDDVVQGIWNRSIAENTSKNGLLDPVGLGKWFSDIPEATREELFDGVKDLPNYKTTMDRLQSLASTQKNLGSILKTAGYLGSATAGWVAGGHSHLNTLGEFIGAVGGIGLAGASSKVGLMDSVIKSIESRPGLWAGMGVVGKMSKSVESSINNSAGKVGSALKAATTEAIGPANKNESQYMVPSNEGSRPQGMTNLGNLPIWNRPAVNNADGSHSTEYSTSFRDEDDGDKEVLVPTIVDGKFLTEDGKKPQEGSSAEKDMFQEAWRHYKETGQNLGKFDSVQHANAYASRLHNRGGSETPAREQQRRVLTGAKGLAGR